MKTLTKARLAVPLFFLALAFFSPGVLSSQTVDFCEEVSASGVPKNSSTLFNIDQKGGFLKVLTTLPYRLGSYQVIYDVYLVDPNGEEKYDNTIYQDTDPEWSWF